MPNRKLKVFICHAKEDKSRVRELYRQLNAEGRMDVWFDEEVLLPGQDWRLEIPKALRSSDVILVCLSNKAVTKEGYVQKEIKEALDVAEEKPEGSIFIIPIRLDECQVPSRLSQWQWLDLFRDGWQPSLLKALKQRGDSIGVQAVDINVHHIGSMVLGGIDLVKVHEGSFLMGSNISNGMSDENELPQHTVTISNDYWIGRYPVTNSQFAEYLQWTKRSHDWPRAWNKKLDHPVVAVTWDEVQEYLDWLNEFCQDDLPKGLNFRLPTEAEWEKTARGDNAYEWPWGNEFNKTKCNSKETKTNGTTPVGRYSPMGDSSHGASDMSGNVWEMTQSIFRRYPYHVSDGREELLNFSFRVARGGSFASPYKRTRASAREYYDPNAVHLGLGFRVVLGPEIE